MNLKENDILKIIQEKQFKLLGLIDVSDKDFDELVVVLKNYVRNPPSYQLPKENLRVSLCMVQIAIRYYGEDRIYWKNLFLLIDEKESVTKEKFLGQTFLKTIERFKLYSLPNKDYNQYVENVKAHALVTNFYMSGYFEFLNQYKKLSSGFLDNYTFNKIHKKIINDLNNKTDFDYYSEYSVKLLKSTTMVLSESNNNLVTDLLYEHMKLIINYYKDKTLPTLGEDRFKKYFISWIASLNKVSSHGDKIDSKNKAKKYTEIDLKSNAKFTMSETGLLINVPKLKVYIRDVFENIYLDFKNGNIDRKIPIGIENFEDDYIITKPINILVENKFKGVKLKIYSAKVFSELTTNDSNFIIYNMQNGIMNHLVQGENKIVYKNSADIKIQNTFIISQNEGNKETILNIKCDKNSKIEIDSNMLLFA